eukprot:Pgem_evm1s9689
MVFVSRASIKKTGYLCPKPNSFVTKSTSLPEISGITEENSNGISDFHSTEQKKSDTFSNIKNTIKRNNSNKSNNNNTINTSKKKYGFSASEEELYNKSIADSYHQGLSEYTFLEIQAEELNKWAATNPFLVE